MVVADPLAADDTRVVPHWCGSGATTCSDAPINAVAERDLSWQRPTLSLNTGTVTGLGAACCKVCRKGKACGDTCIKRSYECTEPPGCACDAEEQ